MDIEPISITLNCLFCDSALKGKEDAEFESGDMIKCTECGEENDYDSILDVAKEKGISEMTKKAKNAFEKELSNIFKK